MRNFSEEGLGIWLPPPAPFGLRPGATVKADILIDHQIHPVELEVVHAYSRFLGVKIRHRSKELADVFHQLLEPTVYADSPGCTPNRAARTARTATTGCGSPEKRTPSWWCGTTALRG